MKDALAGPGTVNVRRALAHLQQSRGRLELEPVIATTEQATRMVTTVELIEEGSFVISRPAAGGAFRPLGRYEEFEIAFQGPQGRTLGRTQALGRVRIAAGEGQTLYGYRMALPTTLQVSTEPRAIRKLLGDDLVREAELHVLGRKGPILGLVEDLDATGARLRCRNAGVELQRGQKAHFKITLPEPVGALHEPVNVVGVTKSPKDGSLEVRVSFRDRNDQIREALRNDRRRSGSTRRSA